MSKVILRTASIVLAMLPFGVLVSCTPMYGTNFDYPDTVPVPESATVLATDTGRDDDDPMRSRQQVIEIQENSLGELLDFYRQTYANSDGWKAQRVGRHQELCLINRSDERFTELLEVFPYRGTRVDARPGRYLVMISRLERIGKSPCGEASSWISLDLL